jgi:hypothetical protein
MMVSKSDWEDAYREAVERGRASVGPPPAPEELVAWSRGELSESEAAHMRERLAYYPDLAAALSEDDEAAEDEAPLLTREQLANDWELIQQRMAPTVSPQVAAAKGMRWRAWMTAIPVLATFMFAGLWVRSLYTIGTLRRQIEQPRENVERVDLYAGVPRGAPSPTPIVLPPSTKHIFFTLNVAEELQARAFRVEIRNLDTTPPTVIWKNPVMRSRDGTFSIEVPRSFLPGQTYQINLHADTSTEPIASNTIWLASSPESP